MSSSIKYSNELGNEITSQQIGNLDGYFKTYYENSQATKTEYYVNGALQNTSYIVQSQSDIDSILINNPTTSFEYLYNQSSYSINESTAYVEGILTEKRINVFNSTGGLICSKLYKLINNVLTDIKTEKYYYDSNNDAKYYFIYNDDGTCFEIGDLQIDNADFYAWSIGVDPDVTFTWTGFEYYQNANPLIPS